MRDDAEKVRDAEWRLLCSIESRKSDRFAIISEAIFYHDETRKMFCAFREQQREGKDLDTFAAAFDCNVPALTISQRMNDVGDPWFWECTVKDFWLNRELDKAAHEAWKSHGIDRLMLMREKLEKLADGISDPGIIKGSHARFSEHLQEEMRIIPTHLPPLDRWFAGFSLGNYVTIAGETSSGKTALALQIAGYIARFSNVPAAVYSFEMNDNEMRRRIVADVANVENKTIRQRAFAPGQLELCLKASEEIEKWPIDFFDCGGMNADALFVEVQKSRASVIVVDYLQIIEAPGDSEKDRLIYTSLGLMRLGRRLKKTIIVLSQLNNSTKGERPSLHNIYGTGQIAKDSDFVFILYEPNREDNENAGIDDVQIEILGRKVRDGERGKKTIRFAKKYQRFYEEEARYPSQIVERFEDATPF